MDDTDNVRLPVPGQDKRRWGHVLNQFLSVSHDEDGTLSSSALIEAGMPTILADLQDVDATAQPDNNQVLAYNSDAATWGPASVQSLAAMADTSGTVSSVAGRTGDVILAESDVMNLTTDLAATEKTAHRGQPGGYASLDSGGKIPMNQLQPYPMPKQSVAVCVTSPVNIAAPGPTLDGLTLTNGSRVLLVAQSPSYPGYQNGIYSYNGANSPMTRTLDANNGSAIQNAFVYVNLGSQAQAGWENVTTGPIGINATPLTWRQFEAPIFSQPTGQLNDSNGNPALLATAVTNPVNQVTITNAVSGGSPIIGSSGTDTNVGLLLDTQGVGSVTMSAAVSIVNPNGGPDLLVQNNSTTNDSVLKVQAWATRAAYVFINSQNVAYGYLAGQVAGTTKWTLGRNGSNNGVTIYTGDGGNKPVVQFDDSQTTRFSGGIAFHRTAVSGASYTALVSDYLIACTNAALAVLVTLPAASAVAANGTQAQQIIVKDEAGGAGANPITINTVNGAPIDGGTQKISTNYGWLQFYSDGTNWHVLA